MNRQETLRFQQARLRLVREYVETLTNELDLLEAELQRTDDADAGRLSQRCHEVLAVLDNMPWLEDYVRDIEHPERASGRADDDPDIGKH